MRIECFARRLFVAMAGVLVCWAVAKPVLAQTNVLPPPVVRSVDANGVDLISGQMQFPIPEISTVGMSRSGTSFSAPFTDNWTGVLNSSSDSNGSYMTVSVGGASEKFQNINGGYVPVQGGVNALNCAGGYCTYTLKDGTAILFDQSLTTKYGVVANAGTMTQMTKPDGEVLNFYYRTTTFQVDTHSQAGVITITLRFLRSVASSLGWMLKYESASTSSYNLLPAKTYIINTAVDYCDPNADTCTATDASSWPTLNFNNSNGVYSDVNGNTLATITSTSIATQTGVTKTLTITNGQVTKVQVGSTYWTYAYSTNGNIQTTTVTDMNNNSRVLTADISKVQVLSDQDELGRKTQYTYDSSGRVSQVIAPDATWSGSTPTGGYTQYAYDSRGNVTGISLYPKGGGTPLTQTASYPGTCSNSKTCNKPDYVIDENGIRTDYTYDPNHGGVLTETKPAVNGVRAQVRYSYSQITPQIKDASGNLVSQANVWRLTGTSSCMTADQAACVGTTDEVTTSVTWNGPNVLPGIKTTSRGDGSFPQTSNISYDNNGNVTYSVAPGKTDGTYTFYDNQNRVVGTISPDPDGSGPRPRMVTRTTYDGDGHIIKSEAGTTTGTTYNDLINNMTVLATDITDFSTTSGLPTVARHYDAGTLTKLVQTSYDNLYRVNCVADRLNSSIYSTITSTDACMLGTAGSDGNDRITKYTYDATGAVLSTVSAYGSPAAATDAATTYDSSSGLITSEADGDGNTTAYTYDNFDRMVKTCYPTASAGSTSNVNDCEQKVFSGNQVNQAILRDGQTINFVYDTLGRVSSKSGAVTESFTYNNFGRVTSHVNNGHTSNYTYNSLGWLSQESNDSIGKSVIAYSYDSTGRRTQLSWPDGNYVAYGYDVGDELISIGVNSTTNSEVSYDYDDYGRRWHLYRSNGQTTTYTYDNSSHLTGLAFPSNTYGFTYTQADQVKTRDDSNISFHYRTLSNATITYGINGLNQIANVNGANFSYDFRGNMSGDGGGAYSYNANNLLTSAVQSGVTTTLTYDAENRLYSVAKNGSTTQFVYDGGNPIAEYDGAGNLLRRYVFGPDADEPVIWYEGSGFSDERWLFADEEGSIVQAGSTINTYDEYGLPGSGNAGRFQYTGQMWLPEIGMYYYKARLYNPVVGRFMQTDPIGYGDGMNWYAYVHDDPVNLRDPSGKDAGTVVTIIAKRPDLLLNPVFDAVVAVAAIFDIFGGHSSAKAKAKKAREKNSQNHPQSNSNGSCLGNVNDFVTAHGADAQILANELGNGVSANEVLAVSGNESGWGRADGFGAEYGNFFGLHGDGPDGTHIATGGTHPHVMVFKQADDYLASGQIFVGREKTFMIPGMGNNPKDFFTILNKHGYATGNSGYPSFMMGTPGARGPYTLVNACRGQ